MFNVQASSSFLIAVKSQEQVQQQQQLLQPPPPYSYLQSPFVPITTQPTQGTQSDFHSLLLSAFYENVYPLYYVML